MSKKTAHSNASDAPSPRGADGDGQLIALDNQLCFALHSAAHAFQRAYKPHLERLKLTYPQYLVMLALWEQGAMSVKALGEALFLDSGTLSPLLKRLEQAGHVIRKRDPGDERQVNITLTPEGLALRQEAFGILNAMLETTGCSIDEATDLREQLQGLRRQLDANRRVGGDG